MTELLQPILQYRPLDRGFFIALPRPGGPEAWARALRALPGELPGRERLTPARAQVFLADGGLVEAHGVPLRWQRAYPWLSSLALNPGLAGDSLRYWASALRLLQSLVIRGAMLPTLDTRPNPWRARWGVSLTSPADRAALKELAAAMPPSALAYPDQDAWVFTKGLPLGELMSEELEDELAHPPVADALLSAFLEDGADFLMRFVASNLRAGDDPRLGQLHKLRGHKRDRLPWDERFMVALSHPMNEFPSVGITERTLGDQLGQWSEGARPQWIRPAFTLEAPPVPVSLKTAQSIQDADRLNEEGWILKAGLETEAGVFLGVNQLWEVSTEAVVAEARATLLRALARATPFFPAVAKMLSGQRPGDLQLQPSDAWAFLTKGASQLKEAGFVVHVPEALTDLGGARRLRAKVKLGARKVEAGGTGLDEAVSADWSLMLGDDQLSVEDFAQMVSLKHPLVAWKGRWVALDPATLKQIQTVLQASRDKGFEQMTRGEALAAALTGTARIPGISEAIEVEVAGDFGAALAELRNLPDKPIKQPEAFRGQLRPYQLRGLAWLEGLARLGLGGILADDMGLGKTIQVLALLLLRQTQSPKEGAPTLLICPTSLLGNWERELKKFAPTLPLFVHHGNNRDPLPKSFKPHTLVLTTYGVARREEDEFAARAWGIVVVDEAQAIKNPGSAQAKAIRRIKGGFRLALTGTPIENRLRELWSILAFALPGYLGSESAFADRFGQPIEKYRDPDAAQELRQRVGPFVLRRLKSDRSIIQDLPEKQEMKVYTTLSREQAALYQARVDQMEQDLAKSSGIERRGKILALLTHLKQICNHPSQFLRQWEPFAGRSGKLDRLSEMLEEVVESGERALVFTQFKEMGDRLQAHLETRLGFLSPFLHGGTTRDQRDAMVRSFQEDPQSAPVMLLSLKAGGVGLKAGGVGLNLTAATHVFHFDRWWNPAVEDQATDRTYRIGQTKNVQVHKLITIGTLEEKIDALLESKRDLADRVVGTGEGWLTELDDDALRRLVALDSDTEVMDEEENGGRADGAAAKVREASKLAVEQAELPEEVKP